MMTGLSSSFSLLEKVKLNLSGRVKSNCFGFGEEREKEGEKINGKKKKKKKKKRIIGLK